MCHFKLATLDSMIESSIRGSGISLKKNSSEIELVVLSRLCLAAPSTELRIAKRQLQISHFSLFWGAYFCRVTFLVDFDFENLSVRMLKSFRTTDIL